MRSRILVLMAHPSRPTMTASQLCNVINDNGIAAEQVKLSSVSSLLVKMVYDKTLERVDGFGPRGGHGYRLRTAAI